MSGTSPRQKKEEKARGKITRPLYLSQARPVKGGKRIAHQKCRERNFGIKKTHVARQRGGPILHISVAALYGRAPFNPMTEQVVFDGTIEKK